MELYSPYSLGKKLNGRNGSTHYEGSLPLVGYLRGITTAGPNGQHHLQVGERALRWPNGLSYHTGRSDQAGSVG